MKKNRTCLDDCFHFSVSNIQFLLLVQILIDIDSGCVIFPSQCVFCLNRFGPRCPCSIASCLLSSMFSMCREPAEYEELTRDLIPADER